MNEDIIALNRIIAEYEALGFWGLAQSFKRILAEMVKE